MRRCFDDVVIQALVLSTAVLRYSVHFMVSVKGAGERGRCFGEVAVEAAFSLVGAPSEDPHHTSTTPVTTLPSSR